MLKRSKLLVVFLVVTVICASIGFAAVSDELTASGGFAFDANNTNQELVDQVNTNVQFVQDQTKIEVTSGNGTGGAVVVSNVDAENVNDQLTITIPESVLLKQGDVVKVTATIKNDNKAPVSLTIYGLDSVNNGAYKDYISVATTGSANRIDGDKTAVVYFIFTLNRVPATSISTEQGTFTFTVTAETLDN